MSHFSYVLDHFRVNFGMFGQKIQQKICEKFCVTFLIFFTNFSLKKYFSSTNGEERIEKFVYSVFRFFSDPSKPESSPKWAKTQLKWLMK